MVDAIVATGASIIDMDFFEALGFKHYQGSQFQDDTELEIIILTEFMILILMKKSFRHAIKAICDVANTLKPKSYTSENLLKRLGNI